MQKITPCLWFDSNAEEAVNFYTSIFKNSKILVTTHYSESSATVSGQPKGSVLCIRFQIEGQEFMALNGGPIYKLSPAISLMIDCETQEEINAMTAKLSEGGEITHCGWLTDKFGMSWQVVPRALSEMMAEKNPAKTEKMMAALMEMNVLDIAKLKAAYDS